MFQGKHQIFKKWGEEKLHIPFTANKISHVKKINIIWMWTSKNFFSVAKKMLVIQIYINMYLCSPEMVVL